jgi:glycosyltransferase involved in cell wall biosynthesis
VLWHLQRLCRDFEKLKTAIYTIALNELQFVERWVNSVREADYLIVADTGSTDGTAKALEDLGVNVFSIAVKPWRFDIARNTALSLIPSDADVCVSMDMDEMMAPGWRQALEKAWQPGTTRLRYTYVWSFDSHDQPVSSFFGDKCHSRHNYTWRRPVHETVFATGDETIVTAPDVVMWHKQDSTKSRGQYLPLLEISHREDPNCHQTLFWLAREYAYHNQHESAVSHFRKYLNFEGTWHEERSEAQRWLSKLLPHEKLFWLRSAAATAPNKREPWIDLADHWYHLSDWLQCLAAVEHAISITQTSGSYLDTRESWGAKPWDLGSIAAWNVGLKHKSLQYALQAHSSDPSDQRIFNNLKVIQSALGDQS